MDFKNLLLSFEGRINRQPFWIGLIVLMIVQWIAYFILMMMFGASMPATDPNMTPEQAAAAAQHAMSGMIVPLIIMLLLFFWPTFAIYAKRWHDRNKSGWWSLLGLIPIVGIWVIIECGFLRGTEGPNNYGPDPLN